MLRLTTALLATAFLVPAAQAADLPAPPVPPLAAWSFTAFGGISWLNDIDVDDDFGAEYELSFDTGYLIGGAVGFTFVDWARTEIEVAYAGYDLSELSEDGTRLTGLDADVGVLTVMGNMWFGFNMLPVVGGPVDTAGSGLGLSPYFGGGLGVGFVDGSTRSGIDWNESDTGLAWQVGAGVRWNFVSNLGLDVGYRYRNVSNISAGSGFDDFDISSHNLVAGVTFNF